MIELDVWITSPRNLTVQVGKIIVAPPDKSRGGRLHAQFHYLQNYLEDENRVALDPINLPLLSKIFSANRPSAGVHGVFEDSLPDDWGRRLLCRKYQLHGDAMRVPSLLQYLGSMGLGALSYFNQSSRSSKISPVDINHLEMERIIEAAIIFEAGGEPAKEELLYLINGGSSPGGARPKMLVQHQEQQWIAKMPSVKDTMDIQALEAACLTLAQKAKIKTPDFHYLKAGQHSFLLVKRFDVTGCGGRNHAVSLKSLLRAENFYYASYRDIAGVISRISSFPHSDLVQLCRQMTFNVMIGNKDDHLKNFCMLHTDEGWHLSPAYDILTCTQAQAHVLSINSKNMQITERDIITEGKAFGLPLEEVHCIVEETKTAISKWRDIIGNYLPDSISLLEGKIWHFTNPKTNEDFSLPKDEVAAGS